MPSFIIYQEANDFEKKSGLQFLLVLMLGIWPTMVMLTYF